jgi:hypothetical protein
MTGTRTGHKHGMDQPERAVEGTLANPGSS